MPRAPWRVLQTLSSSASATVTVSRNGQTQELNLNLANLNTDADTAPAQNEAQGGPERGRADARPRCDARLHRRPTRPQTVSDDAPQDTTRNAATRTPFVIAPRPGLLALAPLALCALALAQQPGPRQAAAQPAAAAQPGTQRITPNFKDADITQITEAVSDGDRQELHHRPARARAGDDAVLHADDAGCSSTGVPVDPAGVRLRRRARGRR